MAQFYRPKSFETASRLRYNFKPTDMPDTCDRCGAKLTVEHTLQCKCGGLVHSRHNDVSRESGAPCAAMSLELDHRIMNLTSTLIFHLYFHERDCSSNYPTYQHHTNTHLMSQTRLIFTKSIFNTDESNKDKMTTKDDRGDVMIRNFWKRHSPCVVYARIMDNEARSYHNK